MNEDLATEILDLLDTKGRDLSRADWIELCDEIASQAKSRSDAAFEDDEAGR